MNMKVVIVSVSILAIAGAIGVIGYPKYLSNKRLTLVEEKIKKHLIDPGSAQFKNVVIYESTSGACGLVNSKNKLGGYVGDKRFVLTKDNIVLFDPQFDHTKKPTATMPSLGSDPSANIGAIRGAQSRYGAANDQYIRDLDKQLAFLKAFMENCPEAKNNS